MQHTTNYNLPQWEAHDPIKRADFNGAMSAIDAALAGGVKLEMGTYVGVGGYGSTKQNTLTFSFPPKIVLIRSTHGYGYGAIFLYPQTLSMLDHFPSGSQTLFLSWSGNSVTWCGSGDDYQLNTNGKTYYYAAIG